MKKCLASVGIDPSKMSWNKRWMCLLMVLSCRLARWMNVSIESEYTPVPLFLGDVRIVSQMFPGRNVGCILGGLGDGSIS